MSTLIEKRGGRYTQINNPKIHDKRRDELRKKLREKMEQKRIYQNDPFDTENLYKLKPLVTEHGRPVMGKGNKMKRTQLIYEEKV
jgi:hypothetical protein